MPGHGGGHRQFGYFAKVLKEAGRERGIEFDVFAGIHTSHHVLLIL